MLLKAWRIVGYQPRQIELHQQIQGFYCPKVHFGFRTRLVKFVKVSEEKILLSRKLICKIHRTKQRESEKFNLQSFYFILI